MSKIFLFGNEFAFLVSSVFGKRKCKRKIASLEKRKRKRKWEMRFFRIPGHYCTPLKYFKQLKLISINQINDLISDLKNKFGIFKNTDRTVALRVLFGSQ